MVDLFLNNQDEEINEDPNYGEIIMEDKTLEELENKFDSFLNEEPPTDETFEEPEKRGDEELPPPELKTLPDNLKYRTIVGHRMCINFRKLNRDTRKYHYLLPFIDQ